MLFSLHGVTPFFTVSTDIGCIRPISQPLESVIYLTNLYIQYSYGVNSTFSLYGRWAYNRPVGQPLKGLRPPSPFWGPRCKTQSPSGPFFFFLSLNVSTCVCVCVWLLKEKLNVWRCLHRIVLCCVAYWLLFLSEKTTMTPHIVRGLYEEVGTYYGVPARNITTTWPFI